MRSLNPRCLLPTLQTALAVSLCVSSSIAIADPSPATPEAITGKTYRLERAYFVSAHVPTADVDKVLTAVSEAVGLDYGRYDQVAYIDAQGREQFRALTGSKAGESAHVARVPTKVVSFSVPHDTDMLKKALDAIYTAHSYEEPVIYVTEVWRTRSTAPDDNNPNRWWNRKTP